MRALLLNLESCIYFLRIRDEVPHASGSCCNHHLCVYTRELGKAVDDAIGEHVLAPGTISASPRSWRNSTAVVLKGYIVQGRYCLRSYDILLEAEISP